MSFHEAKILVLKKPVSKVSEISEKNTKKQNVCTVPMLGEKVCMKAGSTAHQTQKFLEMVLFSLRNSHAFLPFWNHGISCFLCPLDIFPFTFHRY